MQTTASNSKLNRTLQAAGSLGFFQLLLYLSFLLLLLPASLLNRYFFSCVSLFHFVNSLDSRRMIEGLVSFLGGSHVFSLSHPAILNLFVMARLSKDSPLADVRGTIGKEVVFKHYGDKTVVSKYPDMTKVKATALQAARRRLFSEAIRFARLIHSHPELRALYAEELQPGESVFHKAKKEYFNRMEE